MGTSYLLSGLSAYAKAIDLPGFKTRYPYHWVVWEAGDWQPPRSSTIQIDKEAFRKMVAGAESLAMGLEERPGPEGTLLQLTLGRSSRAELAVSDGTISERHLVFTREPAGWNVRDVGSRNGSLLNGVPLPVGDPRLLTNGEQLQAGQVRFTYYTPEGMYARARATQVPTPPPKR
ncbi:MAG: FHA domain-containing protein [Myxococcota bacterium]|nr:FHA domain-containing protein [Myxococcota bacterium]